MARLSEILFASLCIGTIMTMCINKCNGMAQPNMDKRIMEGIRVQDRVKRGGINDEPYRVKRDDYDDPEMSKIKFKIHAKYNWKAHARMANKMMAKWKNYAPDY